MRQDGPILSLFRTHRSALVDYASGLVGNRALAEDLVQEAWLRFDEAAQRRLIEEPLGYLYRIVRNLALDSHRQAARERRVIAADGGTEAGQRPDEQPGPDRVALYRNELALVQEALAELPERTRIAVEMHRIGGCKLREIAAFLGISLPLAHRLVAEGVEHCKRRVAGR